MNTRRLQGWALAAAAVLGLLVLVRSGSTIFPVAFVVGGILLIVGLPAIHAIEPSGTGGLIGLILVELGAVIAVVFNLVAAFGGSGLGSVVPFIGAAAAGIGRLVVGWLTSRGRVFAPWAGWAFIISGLVNFVGGLLATGVLASALGILAPLAEAVALIGYALAIQRSSG